MEFDPQTASYMELFFQLGCVFGIVTYLVTSGLVRLVHRLILNRTIKEKQA